jgi:hypothetical protein
LCKVAEECSGGEMDSVIAVFDGREGKVDKVFIRSSITLDAV